MSDIKFHLQQTAGSAIETCRSTARSGCL